MFRIANFWYILSYIIVTILVLLFLSDVHMLLKSLISGAQILPKNWIIFVTKVGPYFRSKTYPRYLIQNSFPDFLLDAQWEMMHTPLASLIFTRGHIKCYFLAVMCREKTDTQGLVFLFRSSWNALLKNNKNNNNNGSVLHKCQKHSLFSSVLIIIKRFLGKIQKH